LAMRAFLFFGVGRPLGRADAFCLYFLFAILDKISSFSGICRYQIWSR
jgi:hypothetical protein